MLGSQLKGAAAWPGHLSAATLPALLALAPKGATVVAAAEAAATQLATATSNLEQFDKGGELQAAFDAFNAICAVVHAGLKAFALANPALKLGSTYADSFFMHLPRSSQPTSIGAAADLVKQLQNKLGVATKTHADLVAKAQAQTEAVAAHDKAVADAAAKKKQADSGGNVWLTGNLVGSADFGGGVLTSAGDADAFIAKLTGAGGYLGAKIFGDAQTQTGHDIVTDSAGNAIVVGHFQGSIDFGAGPLSAGPGFLDIFVAKFAP